MKALLIYDIPDDQLRGKVADICLDYGLQRIQYSAFFGGISYNRQEEILRKIKGRAGKKPLCVYIFPLCDNDFARHREMVVRADGGKPEC